MRIISKKEENGITTVACLGAFTFSFIEVLDLINAAASFMDKKGANAAHTNKFTFDADGTRYPVPTGELYRQPKRHGAGITGTKEAMLKSLEVTVCVIAGTRRIELSFATEESKKILNSDGEFMDEEEFTNTLVDFVSKLESLGCIMSEQGYSMNAFRKQLEGYAKDPEKYSKMERGSSWFSFDEILKPKQPEEENKE